MVVLNLICPCWEGENQAKLCNVLEGDIGQGGPSGKFWPCGRPGCIQPRAQAGKNRCKSSMAQFEYDYFL